MSRNYFELSLSSEKLKNLDHVFLECMLNEKNLVVQRNENPFDKTYLISVFKDKHLLEVDEKEMDRIVKIFNKMKKDDILISCDHNYLQYITELFKDSFVKIKIIHNILYCNKDDKFLVNFFDHFKEDILISNYNLEYYLNLQNLSIPDIIKDYKQVIRNIYKKNKKTNYYSSANKFDLENINNIRDSKLLKFYYFNESLKSKYILIKSLIEVNQKYNLPTNTISKMMNNLYLDNYIETLNYFSYSQISKYRKIENFQSMKFKESDEAVSYALDLERMSIRGILIPYEEEFHICYEHDYLIPFQNNLRSNKIDIIKILTKITNDKYQYEKYKLSELINIQIYKNIPYLQFSKKNPIKLRFNLGSNIYNLTGKLRDFTSKKQPEFDRSSIKITLKYNIQLIEKIDNYYSISIKLNNLNIILNRDFYIPGSINEFQSGLQKLMEKGYFLTDFGLARYLSFGDIVREDLILPSWLVSNDEFEFNLLIDFFSEL